MEPSWFDPSLASSTIALDGDLDREVERDNVEPTGGDPNFEFAAESAS